MGMFGLGFPAGWFGGGSIELSPSNPVPENTAATPGSTGMASDAGHVHQRLTSSHSGLTTGAGGLLTVNFTRSFATEPAINITPVMSGATQPATFVVDAYIGTAPNITGCVVKAFQAQAVTVGVLGVNVNAFGASAVGVKFTLIALATS